MPKSEIINWYEKMPKDLLKTPDNPNYELHRFKQYFRLCCVASSGSGKTSWLLTLIHLFSKGKKGTFSTITILTRDKCEPLYEYLALQAPKIQIKEGLENLPPLKSFDKDESHLVVFDDLVLAKDLSMVGEYYLRSRKCGVNCVFISQSYYKIPPIVRNNCNYMVLLKFGSTRAINMILSEHGLGVTKEQLIAMYQYATQEKFSPLILDLDEAPENRFRKGFLEILDPKDY